ncbi:unnamed protein product [Caenorhabditis nigoni]
MAENIWEVFDSSVHIINTFEESLMEWIINTQPIVRNVYMLGGVITSFEMLNRIFTSVEVTQYFHLNAIARVKKTKFMEPIPYRAITIDNSYWFSLRSILNGSNSIIRLHDSTLTPTDINTILREWQMGSKLQNLEYLEIWTSTRLDRERSAREMYKDLNDLTDGDESDGRPRTVKIHDGWIYEVPQRENVINLIRNDGMIGSILPSFVLHSESVTDIRFLFQVWSRQT